MYNLISKYAEGGVIDTSSMKGDLKKDTRFYRNNRYTSQGRKRLAAIQSIEDNQNKGYQYDIDDENQSFNIVDGNTNNSVKTGEGRGVATDRGGLLYGFLGGKAGSRKQVSQVVAQAHAGNYLIPRPNKDDTDKDGVDKDAIDKNSIGGDGIPEVSPTRAATLGLGRESSSPISRKGTQPFQIAGASDAFGISLNPRANTVSPVGEDDFPHLKTAEQVKPEQFGSHGDYLLYKFTNEKQTDHAYSSQHDRLDLIKSMSHSQRAALVKAQREAKSKNWSYDQIGDRPNIYNFLRSSGDRLEEMVKAQGTDLSDEVMANVSLDDLFNPVEGTPGQTEQQKINANIYGLKKGGKLVERFFGGNKIGDSWYTPTTLNVPLFQPVPLSSLYKRTKWDYTSNPRQGLGDWIRGAFGNKNSYYDSGVENNKIPPLSTVGVNTPVGDIQYNDIAQFLLARKARNNKIADVPVPQKTFVPRGSGNVLAARDLDANMLDASLNNIASMRSGYQGSDPVLSMISKQMNSGAKRGARQELIAGRSAYRRSEEDRVAGQLEAKRVLDSEDSVRRNDVNNENAFARYSAALQAAQNKTRRESEYLQNVGGIVKGVQNRWNQHAIQSTNIGLYADETARNAELGKVEAELQQAQKTRSNYIYQRQSTRPAGMTTEQAAAYDAETKKGLAIIEGELGIDNLQNNYRDINANSANSMKEAYRRSRAGSPLGVYR